MGGGIKYFPKKVGGSEYLGPAKLQPGEEVYFPGINMDAKMQVLANNPKTKTIAIKASSGTHWVGNYLPRAYHSPQVLILDYDGNCLIEWDVTRKRQEKPA